MHRRGGVVDEVTHQRPQEDPSRRVLEIDPLQVALPVEHGVGAHATKRGAAAVQHHRISDVPARVAPEPGAVGEIPVLVRGKEGFVEAPEFPEHRRRHQARRPGHPEYFARLREAGRLPTVAALERATSSGHAVTGTVNHVRVVHVDHARGHQRYARSFIKTATQAQQPLRVRVGVVVEERHQRGARLTHTRVIAARKSSVGRQLDEAHPGKLRAHVRGGAVGRSVVDQDRFSRDTALRPHGCQAPLQMMPAVPRHDHDGHVRGHAPITRR